MSDCFPLIISCNGFQLYRALSCSHKLWLLLKQSTKFGSYLFVYSNEGHLYIVLDSIEALSTYQVSFLSADDTNSNDCDALFVYRCIDDNRNRRVLIYSLDWLHLIPL